MTLELKKLLEKCADSCEWVQWYREEFIDKVMKRDSIESLKKDFEDIIASIDYSIENEALDCGDVELASELEEEKRILKSIIPFYYASKHDKYMNFSSKAFYDYQAALEYARKNSLHYAVFLSLTTVDEVKEILNKANSDMNPRSEEALSYVSKFDMVFNELESTY